MFNKALAAFSVCAAMMTTVPALAGSWDENLSLCAAAAEQEGFVTAGKYRAKFIRGGGGRTKTISIELVPDNGDAMEAVCKIRSGEVSEIRLEA